MIVDFYELNMKMCLTSPGNISVEVGSDKY